MTDKGDCFIVGDLISLRLPDIEKDVMNGRWHSWFNNERITRFLVHGTIPNSVENQAKFVSTQMADPAVVIFSIIDNKTERMVGVTSLKNIDHMNRVAEITLVMGDEPYSLGSSLQAMALMTQYGFDRLNLNKIKAGQHVGLWEWVNTLELIGYRLEGYISETHIKNRGVSDSVRVGITLKKFEDILKERDGHYLTENLYSLLRTRRKENMCEKLRALILGFYD